jgi:iron complex outermembrane receptor protein
LQGVAQFGGFEVRNSQDAATNLKGDTNRREGYNATLSAKFALTDTLSLTSITGYRQFERHNGSNSDGASTGLGDTFYNENNNQFSQEVVLNYENGPLELTGGASYYHEKLDNYVFVPFPQFGGALPYIQDGTLGINALAVYAQGTYSITPGLRLTAAGRYSTEKRTSDGTFTFIGATPIDDERRWSAFTPKFGVELDLNSTSLVYASYTKGFKSGTFNVGQVNPAINPEKITAYEAGIKSRFLNNLVDVTAAVFHYDYTDLQVNKIVGIATLTTNAAAAKTTGVELAINARPAPGLSFDANFTYLDAKFSEFSSISPIAQSSPAQNLKGKLLPGSPKYALTGGAQYIAPLGGDVELTFNADASYQSRVYFSEFNDEQLSQKPVTKVNASVKLDTGHNWSVTVWGKNVFNELVANNKILGIALWGYPIYGAYDAPATFGGTLAVKF